MNSLKSSLHYHPDIQGLRAVAVLIVVVYHSGLPGFPGGYVGVDVFFVISGYLITSLLLRELGRDQTISLSKFYARRFRRLLPAASVVILATTAMAWFVYSPLSLKQFSSSAFTTAVYLSNFWFAHLSTDYLAEDTTANPLLHTWSLGVEEQFYLVWPLLLLATLRYGRPIYLHRRLMVMFSIVFVVSFAFSYWLTGYNQPWAFFGSPTRAWEFAIGGLIALWFFQGRSLSRGTALLLSWVGLGMILISATTYSRATPFPGAAALLPVVGASLLIGAAHTKDLCGASIVLATRPMQFIGNISYSLYLWHWPVFVFLALLSREVTLQQSLLSISLVVVLAWGTLLLVENPVRFNRRLSSSIVLSLVFGGALTAATAAVVFGVRGIAAMNLDDPLQKAFLAAESDIPRIYGDGCHLDFFSTESGECSYGNTRSKSVIVLFGDSHAAQWFPALEPLAKENDWRLVSLTKSGCASAKHEQFNKQLGRTYTECTEWRQNALARIKQLRPRLTVISNYSVNKSNIKNATVWKASMDGLLLELAPISERVVIIRDTPRLETNAPNCLSQAMWRGHDLAARCRVSLIDATEDQMFTAEKRSAAKFDNVVAVDMTDSICLDSGCPVYSNSLVKFRDDHHLTARFTVSVKFTLGQALELPYSLIK